MKPQSMPESTPANASKTTETNNTELALCVRRVVSQYFDDLGGEPSSDLHAMLITSIEKPLLEVVMQRAGGNQTRAAIWLGLNRNTLNKKLKAQGLE
jgi:Fis family transcriptional regulator, factor for inversion stimulation protein